MPTKEDLKTKVSVDYHGQYDTVGQSTSCNVDVFPMHNVDAHGYVSFLEFKGCHMSQDICVLRSYFINSQGNILKSLSNSLILIVTMILVTKVLKL